jgi:hypothetical protein
MKYQRQILIVFLILAALFLVFAACSEKSLKGDLLAPRPPSIFWAQVPTDSLNHFNPNLHWFSTDQDGVVLDYQYTVLYSSTVDSLIGSGSMNTLLANFPTGIPWTIIHTDSATIPLYSVADTMADGTPVYVDQYVFIKAMDEDSLFSDIIYKHLARNNHPPTCYLVVPTTLEGNPEPKWCLPETTSTWKGIRVAWVGKDSIDIPGSIQPDFEWNIRLYGPYNVPPDSIRPDTTTLYEQFYADSTHTNPWIKSKQLFLTNLQTGTYWLYARNRDDAFTPSVPALAKLIVYEPTWIRHPENTRPILIANHSYFYNGVDPNNGRSAGELLIGRRDSVRNFYMQLIQNAGYDTSSDVDWKDYQVLNSARPVPKADLYNHRLVIILDTDYTKPLKTDIQESEYSLYLDVNGMIWIIGRQSFNENSAGGTIEFNANGDANRFHSIAYRYFNLSSVYAQQELDMHQAEFAGAASIQPGFPDLAVDTLAIAQCNWARPVPGADTVFYRYSHGLFGVDYLSRRNDDSKTIYKFKAVNPDTSRFEGFPVAVRWDKGTFKTSYFCFPLYFIQRDQAEIVMQQMLTWFNPRGYEQ